MKVALVMDWDDEARAALAQWQGESGLATRATIRAWMLTLLNTTLEDIVNEQDRRAADSDA